MKEQAPPIEFTQPARLGKLGGLLLLTASISAFGVATVQFLSGKPIYPFSSPAAGTGLLNVSTPGTSVEVFHREHLLGKTPISLSLAAGEHELVLRGHGAELRLTVPITAGEPSSVSLPFPAPVSQGP